MQRHKHDLFRQQENPGTYVKKIVCICKNLFAMPCGRPATRREEYMRIKLHRDMHCLWIERKRVLQLRSDNELALHLLDLPSASPSTNLPSAVCDTSQEREKMPATELLRDQNMEVNEDNPSTEIQDLSFVCGKLSAGSGVEDAISSTHTRYLLTKKVY